MSKEALNWKARKAGRTARIIGAKPSRPAPAEQPRERTLRALAQHTGQRPGLRSLLAEAAATMGRWA